MQGGTAATADMASEIGDLLGVSLKEKALGATSTFSVRDRCYFHNQEGKCLCDSTDSKYMLSVQRNNLGNTAMLFSLFFLKITPHLPPWLFKRQ